MHGTVTFLLAFSLLWSLFYISPERKMYVNGESFGWSNKFCFFFNNTELSDFHSLIIREGIICVNPYKKQVRENSTSWFSSLTTSEGHSFPNIQGAQSANFGGSGGLAMPPPHWENTRLWRGAPDLPQGGRQTLFWKLEGMRPPLLFCASATSWRYLR